ncbi:MAG: transcriptional repressor [Kineosporiaceae bacterium]|nr:transcriptional repressor [Kineosporiaceae bacterium]
MVISGARPAVRTTRQRTAVAGILEEIEGFRTAQQVHELLRGRGEQIGLTTVYRSLQLLAADGAVDSLRDSGGEVAYRRCRSARHHHHLVCRSCGRTVEIAPRGIERAADRIAVEHGFTDASHLIEIFGVCPDCTATPTLAR